MLSEILPLVGFVQKTETAPFLQHWKSAPNKQFWRKAQYLYESMKKLPQIKSPSKQVQTTKYKVLGVEREIKKKNQCW